MTEAIEKSLKKLIARPPFFSKLNVTQRVARRRMKLHRKISELRYKLTRKFNS